MTTNEETRALAARAEKEAEEATQSLVRDDVRARFAEASLPSLYEAAHRYRGNVRVISANREAYDSSLLDLNVRVLRAIDELIAERSAAARERLEGQAR